MASSSSSSSICQKTCSSLADDILIQIFCYLPLNLIYKFKCLSKVWRSNLSHPYFIIKWFQTNKKYLPWVIYHKRSNHSKMSYPDLHSDFMRRNGHLFSFQFLMNEKPFQGAKLYPLCSSKGLVLCCSVAPDDQGTRRYHVCNPLTQKWVSLPSPPTEYGVAGIYCECEDQLSNASCYKVVHIPTIHKPSEKFNVDVFSSDLGVWGSFEVSCDLNIPYGKRNKKFVIHHGVLYWLQGLNKMLVCNLNQNNGSDVYRGSLINLPPASGFNEANKRIGISEGWLCYTKTRCTAGKNMMSVWMLDEVNWKIVHEDIRLDDILADLFYRRRIRAPIEVIGFSPINCNVVLLGSMDMVWEFNIQTKIVEELLGFNITNGEQSCLDKRNGYLRVVFQPFVLEPMPTVIPPPYWVDT